MEFLKFSMLCHIYIFPETRLMSCHIDGDLLTEMFSLCRYEFLWTRTRAIRKDITQQRLCSPTIVSIVEKITRFHIFCAARLVDQSMDAFDSRINSENLTQCLQTLKELYYDIKSAASGENSNLCPCEAEFRAYMILMKLNECSVLEWVISKLYWCFCLNWDLMG